MKKLNLKKKDSQFIYMLFIFIVLVGLFFKLVPSIGKTINKLAVFSTKLNFSKNFGFGECFKNLNLNKDKEALDEKPQEIDITQEEKKEEKIDGTIVRRQYEPLNTSKFVNLQGTAFVRNMTSLPNDVILKAAKKPPAFGLETTNEPQVLIYHTHTTESYEPFEKDQYDSAVPTRSKDVNLNVVGVGEEIVKQLKARGINTIHDTKIYDDPAYNCAYDRTNAMINRMLKEHKKIKVVLDIHRDSITNKEKQRIAPITMVNGEKVAQLMIISGCDNGSNRYKTYEKNLSFACALENQLEKDFPKITRPVSFKYKHYNQSLSPGALLIEVGSQANSAKEAKLCGMYFGTSLSNLLLRLQAPRNPGNLKKPEQSQNLKKADDNKNEKTKKEKNKEVKKDTSKENSKEKQIKTKKQKNLKQKEKNKQEKK